VHNLNVTMSSFSHCFRAKRSGVINMSMSIVVAAFSETWRTSYCFGHAGFITGLYTKHAHHDTSLAFCLPLLSSIAGFTYVATITEFAHRDIV